MIYQNAKAPRFRVCRMFYDNRTQGLFEDFEGAGGSQFVQESSVRFFPTAKRIVIFTSECLVAQKHLEGILPFMAQNNLQPVIFFTPGTKSPRANIAPLQRFSFYEEGIFNETIYPYLESKRPEKGARLSATFNELVKQYDCEPHRLETMKDPAVLRAVQSPATIGALSIYHDAIFKADLITAVKEKGFFWNVHPAILPKDRGLYAAFWNRVNGVNRHGTSLHEIDEGIDTGGLISTYRQNLHKDRSILEAYFEVGEGGASLVRDALKSYLRSGKVESQIMATEEGNYYTFPTESDIAVAEERGINLCGRPEDMVEMYTRMFGADPVLKSHIVEAIADYEGLDPNWLRAKTSTAGSAPVFSLPAYRRLTV
ncbi:MAG: hypothetical protein DI551_00970 [Micavibrio aeruginosavorus]|uniref:Formyl transferase N-terminal domain-containing protein n=1 Tax=Micavibrio aeruginosavorus TaxID=349221 RepID=A0A2W5N5I5_9BACT|nr:MAG: hypothetical protein DI551_00970 [Micavibrio aeruginosavorus]